MNILTSRIILVAGLLTLSGCPAPWIRVPSLYPANPAAERASFTQNDPLPDSSLGPNTNGRPREAIIQRSEPRRTMEAGMPSMVSPVIPGGVAPAPYVPPAANSYPNTVVP